MGLIKSKDAPGNLAAFSMNDIEEAARKILLRANHQADQVIAAAQTEAQAIKREARVQGLAEGKRLGVEQGTEEGKKTGHAQALAEHGPALLKLNQALTQMLAQINEERDQLETVGLRGVIELAGALARRVIKRQAALDPNILFDNLRETMSLVVHAADVRISVHPSQRQTLERELPNLKSAWPQLKHVELVDDAAISPGGARVSTVGGQVNGELDTQLDNIMAELLPEGRGL